MLHHIGLYTLIGIAGLIVVIVAIGKSKGAGDKLCAFVGAVVGLVLAATNVGRAIHAAILRALHVPAPSPYSYDWYAIGGFALGALILLVVILWLGKGARAQIIFAFLGMLLFVASTGLGQVIYSIFVG